MHLHQELEGYYLGTPTGQTFDGSAVAPSVKIGAKAPRAAVSRKQRQIDITPKTVLLILEDFDEIRAFLMRHFDRRGYEVYSSATLRDALAIAWEETPRIILIDHDLRGETHGKHHGRCGPCSLHAIERLHGALPETYIVLIGGPQTEEVTEQAILAGASKVLSKAYAISEMNYIIGSVGKMAGEGRVPSESESFS